MGRSRMYSPVGSMARTASNTVQKVRALSHKARSIISPSSSGSLSSTWAMGLRRAVSSAVSVRTTMPCRWRLPPPKGTSTRQPRVTSPADGGRR